MDFHVMQPGRAPELIVRVVDGQLIIVPAPPAAAALAQPAPGK